MRPDFLSKKLAAVIGGTPSGLPRGETIGIPVCKDTHELGTTRSFTSVLPDFMGDCILAHLPGSADPDIEGAPGACAADAWSDLAGDPTQPDVVFFFAFGSKKTLCAVQIRIKCGPPSRDHPFRFPSNRYRTRSPEAAHRCTARRGAQTPTAGFPTAEPL